LIKCLVYIYAKEFKNKQILKKKEKVALVEIARTWNIYFHIYLRKYKTYNYIKLYVLSISKIKSTGF